MNRALELWKNVTDLTEEDDSPPAKPACYSAGKALINIYKMSK